MQRPGQDWGGDIRCAVRDIVFLSEDFKLGLFAVAASCYRSALNDDVNLRPIESCIPQGALRQSLCGSLKKASMTSKRSKLQEDTHFRVLRLLQDNPEMSQRELAQAVGVSVGGMHYVLNALIEKGLVKLGNFTAAEDKRRYAYVLTRKGIAAKADLTKRFLVRKMAEYELLKSEIEEVRGDRSDAEMAKLKAVTNEK